MSKIPKRPAEGRRARRHRETRAALLDAAMGLLQERGIYGARVEDITQRADVGKGVFYNYFESKEALIAHLVSGGVEVLERDYLQNAAAERTLAGRIEQLAGAQEAFFCDHPEFAILFHQARGLLLLEGERAVRLRAAFADYLQRLVRHIPDARDAAAWSAADLLDVAAVIVGAAAGYRSFCIAVGQPIHGATIGTALAAGLPQLLESLRGEPADSNGPHERARSAR